MGSLDVDASGDCMTIEGGQDYIAEEGGTVRLSSEVITGSAGAGVRLFQNFAARVVCASFCGFRRPSATERTCDLLKPKLKLTLHRRHNADTVRSWQHLHSGFLTIDLSMHLASIDYLKMVQKLMIQLTL